MKKQTIRRVLRFVKPYLFFVLCSFFAAAASVATDLLVPIFAGNAIDCMIYGDTGSRAAVLPILLKIVFAAAGGATAKYILSVSNNRIAFSVSRDLRNAALEKIETLPLSYLDAHPVGDLTARVIADVDQISDGLLMGFTQFFYRRSDDSRYARLYGRGQSADLDRCCLRHTLEFCRCIVYCA